MAVLVIALLSAPVATAQDRLQPSAEASRGTLTDGSKPVVLVTVGSINKLMADVNYVTGVVGQPGVGGIFSMMAGMYGQGMDMDQPIGVLVPLVGGAPQPLVVVPTKDIRAILKRIEAQTGPVDELDDGTLVITINQSTLYIKQLANAAVAAQQPDVLKLAPANPTELYSEMGKAYDLAVRLQVQQIPMEMRNVLIDQLRQGFEQAMRQQQGEDASRELAESSIQQLETVVKEADELAFGIDIDQSQQLVGIDFSFTALPGTQMAAVYGGQQAIPSRFASVIRDDAAAYVHSATSISPEAIDQAKTSIESSMGMLRGAIADQGNMPPEQVREFQTYLDRLTDIIMGSLAEGKGDTGAIVLAGSNQFQFALGTFVGDGTKVADLAKDLATKVPDVPDAPKFKFDLGEFSGVTMHLVEVDVPADKDEVRAVFGEKIQVHIGTAPKAIYLAAGRGSKELLQNLITAGKTDTVGDRPLSQFKMRLLPFMQLAQSVETNDVIEAMVGALAGSTDKGEMTVVGKAIPNGSSGRMTIGEGMLKAIGAAVAAAQQQQQQAF